MNINYFEMFPYMQTFIISDVELETLQVNIFRKAENLTKLDASRNKLKEIPSLIFFNAVKLKYVDLSNNKIKLVDPMAFEGVNGLKTLNLSYNRISELDSRILNLPNLLILDISTNNLTKLSEHVFDKLVNLKQLNLAFNAMGNLEIQTFTYLINLEELNLRCMNLLNIQFGTFSHQQNLVSLDLSENNLKKLDFKLFFPILHDLRSLRLGKNQLKDLNGFRNTLFPQLNSLDIQSNQFNCSYLVRFMESINWEKIHFHLDVSSIDVRKSNIRGISCNMNDSDEITGGGTTIDALTEAKITQNRPCQNFSTLPNYLDESTIKLALIFICVSFTIFVILFILANLNRIHSQLVKPLTLCQRGRKHSSKENAVKFLNEEGVFIT